MKMSPSEFILLGYKRIRNKQNIVAFCSALLIGILTHAYMLTNKIPNFDDVYSLDKMGPTIRLGRWFLYFLGATEYHLGILFSVPWFNGVMTLFIICCSVILLREIFQLESCLYSGLLGGLVIVFPSWVGHYFYMFTVMNYSIAFFLAILGVYFLRKNKKLLAIILFVCSTATYQSYITVVATILLLCILMDVAVDKNDFSMIIHTFSQYICILILSLGIYFLSVKATLFLTHQTLYEYKGLGESSQFHLSNVFQGIKEVLNAWVSLFYCNKTELCFNWLMNVLYLSSFVLSSIIVLYLIFSFARKERKKQMFMCVITYCLLHLASVSIFFLNANGNDNVYILMLFSIDILLIMPLVLTEKIKLRENIQNMYQWFAVSIASICIFMYIAFANIEYLSLDLCFKQANSYYTTLITQIKSVSKYDDSLEVMFVGDTITDLSSYENDIFHRFSLKCRDDSLVNIYSRMEFMQYYCGFVQSYRYCEKDEYTDSMKAMPCYPKDGSIQRIGNQIIVKIEDL